MKYKCSVVKPINLCKECNHAVAHDYRFNCGGTCSGAGHLDDNGEPVTGKQLSCVEIPESIEAEEI